MTCSGLTFKENAPDLRDSRVADALSELRGNGVGVEIEDRWTNSDDAALQIWLRAEMVAAPKVSS